MAFIQKQDTDGTKAILLKGELGYDDYTAGGDTGRVYIGDGSTNHALSFKAEADLLAPIASPTFTGTVTLPDGQGITNLTTTGSITEEIAAVPASALDPLNGTIQTLTMSGNVTFTDSLTNGSSMTLMIDPTVSAWVVTWPTCRWIDGLNPTLIGGKYTVVEFWKVADELFGAYVGIA